MQALLLFISGFPAVCFQSKVTDKISGNHNVPHFQTARCNMLGIQSPLQAKKKCQERKRQTIKYISIYLQNPLTNSNLSELMHVSIQTPYNIR